MMILREVRRSAWVVFGTLPLVLAGCSDSGTATGPRAGSGQGSDTEQPDKAHGGERTSTSTSQDQGEAPPGEKPEAGPAQAPQPAQGAKEDDMPEHPFPGAQKAPSFEGGLAWINTAGPLDVKDLRGKFVLLDFWTYCCINCMHILPELKKLERAYPNEIVVIGVHSAKFETEQDSQNITDAVLRYEIEHPVVNDANHAIWQRYGVNSWPSLRIIDPEGNLVAGDSGEVEFELLDGFLKKVLPYYKKKGLLDETPLRFDLEAHLAETTPLRYPGKILADEAGQRLFIADSNHNRIVIANLAGKLLDVIGSGKLGKADGDYAQASFDHPQGMALHEKTLYVADTENHLLRKVDLEKKQVATTAGTGKQARGLWPGIDRDLLEHGDPKAIPERYVAPPLKTAINSPWDLWIHQEELYIAMAGPHQIWKMPLNEKEIGPFAGNGREDIVDGPLLPRRPYEEGYSSFAQPSGLASDGAWLYVADSEGSSIRAVPFDPKKEVRTVIGTAHLPVGRLFAFGDIDGDTLKVRLQHALGVAHHAGQLYVADTYNNKIKVVDLEKESIQTLVGVKQPGRRDDPPEFDEPAGLAYAGGKLYVADTNNHLIRVVDLKDGNKVTTLTISGLQPPDRSEPEAAPLANLPGTRQIELPAAVIKPVEGSIRLAIKLQLPTGYKINPRAPMSYRVESLNKQGVVFVTTNSARVKEPAAEFEIPLLLTANAGDDKLRLTLTYYYCQEQAEGLCKVGTVAWTLPLKLTADATDAVATIQHTVE